MPATTTSYAKNIIRRALCELVDRPPSKAEINLLWTFFESKCAYCARPLKQYSKNGHVDHLLSASCGGANHISNRVLACAPCNEKEKRDLPWKQFLRSKCADNRTFAARKKKIAEWVAARADGARPVTPQITAEVDASVQKIVRVFTSEVARIRKVTSSNGFQPTQKPSGLLRG